MKTIKAAYPKETSGEDKSQKSVIVNDKDQGKISQAIKLCSQVGYLPSPPHIPTYTFIPLPLSLSMNSLSCN